MTDKPERTNIMISLDDAILYLAEQHCEKERQERREQRIEDLRDQGVPEYIIKRKVQAKKNTKSRNVGPLIEQLLTEFLIKKGLL